MVSSDNLGNTNREHTGKEDSKMMLTKVRYINKKESIMCFCHLDDKDLDHEVSTSPEDGSESDSEMSKHSDSDSTDIQAGSRCNGKLSKRKEEKLKRKSVRFLFDDHNFDASSTVSEPIKSVHTIDDLHTTSFLPPITNVSSNVPAETSQDDSHTKVSNKEPLKWANKRQTAVPERMFKTLNSLSLSPRVTRKMSLETLHDIKKAIVESRESIKRTGISHHQSKRIHQRGLQSIPEVALARTKRPMLPRRLIPVEPPLVKSPLSMTLACSDAEQDRLDFIKRALSPMPEGAASEAFRNRAATISGGEKRSWLIERRNSRENVWSQKKTGQSLEPYEQSGDFLTLDLTRL